MATENNSLNYLENYKAQVAKKKKILNKKLKQRKIIITV